MCTVYTVLLSGGCLLVLLAEIALPLRLRLSCLLLLSPAEHRPLNASEQLLLAPPCPPSRSPVSGASTWTTLPCSWGLPASAGSSGWASPTSGTFAVKSGPPSPLVCCTTVDPPCPLLPPSTPSSPSRSRPNCRTADWAPRPTGPSWSD